ncbi:hypothetical protein NKJ72_19940 [Mesorhizobium sp. M0045]|uniref:hypothetical protein n=1 Tax=Mesorhizobium sp. M0045 TaxID=2956857 RepID=UPI003338C3BF
MDAKQTVAPLPIALGDPQSDLVLVVDSIHELTRALRVLTHPDGRHLQRVKAFFELVGLGRRSDETDLERPL